MSLLLLHPALSRGELSLHLANREAVPQYMIELSCMRFRQALLCHIGDWAVVCRCYPAGSG